MQDCTRKRSIEFVVLTWNSAAYIENCLASVLAITAFDIKLHVIDNGSTDGTLDLIEAYIEASDGRMDAVRVGKNLGTTVSRNIALRAVGHQSDYVCILDSDTVVNDSAFVAMADALDGDPTIGVIGPKMRTSSGALQLSGRNLPTIDLKLRKAMPIKAIAEAAARSEVPDSPIVDGLRDVGYLLSACWLIPRRIFDDIGLLDENIFYAPEDVDFCVRARNAGFRVVYCEAAEIVHEYQRISKKKLVSKTNLEHVKGLAHYFKKHRYLFDTSKPLNRGRTK